VRTAQNIGFSRFLSGIGKIPYIVNPLVGVEALVEEVFQEDRRQV